MRIEHIERVLQHARETLIDLRVLTAALRQTACAFLEHQRRESWPLLLAKRPDLEPTIAAAYKGDKDAQKVLADLAEELGFVHLDVAPPRST